MADFDKYSVSWWLDAVNRAQKGDMEKWFKRAEKVQKLYDAEDEKDAKSFNVLWANVQTMLPSLYSDTPRPEISNRWYSENPVARTVSTVLERGIEFSIDFLNFDRMATEIVLDYLVPGRGTARVRYKPYFGAGDPVRYAVEIAEDGSMTANGEAVGENDIRADGDGFYAEQPGPERKVYEEVYPEHVYWKDLIHPKAKKWDRLPWIAFRHDLTKDEIREQFGARKANQVSFDTVVVDGEDETVEVFEVWDRINRKVCIVTEGLDDFLMREGDPLGLADFFPMPEPAYSVPRSGSLIPKPEYTLYQALAAEVDDLTQRITSVAGAIRGRGVYPKELHGLLDLLADAPDNELVAVENWHQFMEKGGLAGIINWLPVDEMAKALVVLVRERNNAMQTIYEITGISDIQRGASDPRETKGAQQIKVQSTGKRLRLKQRDIQRLFRDLYRLMAEIMAEHFDARTFTMISGIPVRDEHVQVMSSDVLRTFAIDIETDSTIYADEQQDKQDTLEFMNAAGTFMAGIGPLIEKRVLPFDAGKAILLAASRRFRFGRDVEDQLNQMAEPQPAPPTQLEQMQIDDAKRRAQEGAQREASRAKKTDADVRESGARVFKIGSETMKNMSEALDEPGTE
ncbi:MAG: hypothetical protein OEQ74_05065 [Gammaproteobacteria bacterium]|nr:hypothetical protein [Gammaproteobacteria bacterium]